MSGPLCEPCVRAFEIREASLAFTSRERGTLFRRGAFYPCLPPATLILGPCLDLGVCGFELHVLRQRRLDGDCVWLLATLDHVPPPTPA